MSFFEAKVSEIDGRKSVTLDYKLNSFDRRARQITISEDQKLRESEQLPFSYQFIEETLERKYSTIKIAAAPGISINLDNFPDEYNAETDGIPLVEIYRIQDHAVIPPIGIDLRRANFAGSYEINPFDNPLGLLPLEAPIDYFQVTHKEDGVVIRHPFTNRELIIEVDQLSKDKKNHKDAKARFSFAFDLESKEQPLVKIVKTPEVRVKEASDIFLDNIKAGLKGEKYDVRKLLASWIVYEVKNISDIPPQGSPIEPQEGWRQIKIDRGQPLSETIATSGFDMSLGFIPIVGDITDIAEFIYGIKSGKDKWGQPLSTGTLFIMGIAALLPFVTVGLVKGGTALVRRFGTKGEVAKEAIETLRKTGLNDQEIRLIRDAQSTILAGRQLPADMLARYKQLIQKIRNDYPVAQDFLNIDETGFIHFDLQQLYQNYKKSYVPKNPSDQPKAPTEWVRVTRGRARQILEKLLGPDFIKRAGLARRVRIINLSNIPRPAGYTDELVNKHIKELLNHRKDLVDRLETLLKERSSGDALKVHLVKHQVNEGHFKILKGNIAEVLSLELQLRILRDIKNGHNLWKRPLSDVKIFHSIRVLEKSRSKKDMLFSDNIIGFIRNGNLYVLGVIEAKSGYHGGQEATEQIFKWLEDILTEGSIIKIGKDSKIIGIDGKERLVRLSQNFVYNPSSKTWQSYSSF